MNTLNLLIVSAVALGSGAAAMSVDTAGNPALFKAEKTIQTNSTKLASGSGSWTMYKQCDSSWAGQELGTCSGTTICDAVRSKSKMRAGEHRAAFRRGVPLPLPAADHL